MTWSKKLFIGDEAKKKKISYLWKLKRGKGVFGLYVITLASNPANQLDIIDSREFMGKRYPKRDAVIVGIAKGYDDAVELVNHMAQVTVTRTGDADIRGFLTEEAGL